MAHFTMWEALGLGMLEDFFQVSATQEEKVDEPLLVPITGPQPPGPALLASGRDSVTGPHGVFRYIPHRPPDDEVLTHAQPFPFSAPAQRPGIFRLEPCMETAVPQPGLPSRESSNGPERSHVSGNDWPQASNEGPPPLTTGWRDLRGWMVPYPGAQDPNQGPTHRCPSVTPSSTPSETSETIIWKPRGDGWWWAGDGWGSETKSETKTERTPPKPPPKLTQGLTMARATAGRDKIIGLHRLTPTLPRIQPRGPARGDQEPWVMMDRPVFPPPGRQYPELTMPRPPKPWRDDGHEVRAYGLFEPIIWDRGKKSHDIWFYRDLRREIYARILDEGEFSSDADLDQRLVEAYGTGGNKIPSLCAEPRSGRVNHRGEMFYHL
ncbi:hypothetical protein F4803DRAFT_575435 [Xylaria telfairii]|nr:hypothetical protein F4803DRAFT_575435 [Xylaria telfairii]